MEVGKEHESQSNVTFKIIIENVNKLIIHVTSCDWTILKTVLSVYPMFFS